MQVDLPQGGVLKLEAFYGSDLDVVNAAKVSFDARAAEYGETEDKILWFLMKNKHGSPFEHNYFRWYVEAPILVFREWHRHRSGWSYNEMSGRYTQLERRFYEPRTDEVRVRVGRPGSYTYETASETVAINTQGAIRDVSSYAYEKYQLMLDDGVAPEVARSVLPVGTFSKMWASCNARSLMHFLNLRSADNAQREIRAYAQAMELEFIRVMPRTHEAWDRCGRVSP